MENSFEYINKRYNVFPKLNQAVTYKGQKGQIVGDTGNYLLVTFLDEAATKKHPIHPTDDCLEYLDEILPAREMTRSQIRYQQFLNSDSGMSFGEWLAGQKKYQLFPD